MIEETITQYRAAVNFYIRLFWRNEPHSWDAMLPRTRLSARYVSAARKQAQEIVRSARRGRNAQRSKMPIFRGFPVLDAKFVTVREADLSHFDYIVKLSTLKKGTRMAIPFCSHSRLQHWLDKPEAQLKDGCILPPDYLTLWVEMPDPTTKTTGDEIGADIGYDRLLVTSDGEILDDGDHKRICQKIARKTSGSKAIRKARKERHNHIGAVVNRLPWSAIKTIVVEDLKHLKRGKRTNRNKNFRKALSPWTYRQVIARIKQKAQEYGVLVVAVDPRNTSRECPMCGAANKENRQGAVFCCVSCGHRDNADKVGAINILRRHLAGSVRS